MYIQSRPVISADRIYKRQKEMINIEIAPSIKHKLKTKHNVEIEEVIECFANVTQGFVQDTREEHKTNPPTHYFIEQTDNARLLCIAFIHTDETIVLKTAFEPSQKRIQTYKNAVGK